MLNEDKTKRGREEGHQLFFSFFLQDDISIILKADTLVSSRWRHIPFEPKAFSLRFITHAERHPNSANGG